MADCPQCKGKGYFSGYGFPGFIFSDAFPCDICKGDGEMPEGMEYDPAKGKEIKQMRISHRMLMREYAGIMKRSLAEQSQMERGFFRRKECVIA